MNSYLVILICFGYVSISCSQAQKQPNIIPLTMLNYIDTFNDRGKQVISKSDFYLIQRYRENKRTESFIKQFVNKSKDANFQKYSQYKIIFFKESKKTNVKNISASTKVIDRYSNDNDRIFEYHWYD